MGTKNNKISEEIDEIMRVRKLMNLLGKMDKETTDLIVEFLEIKPSKLESFKLASKVNNQMYEMLSDVLLKQ